MRWTRQQMVGNIAPCNPPNFLGRSLSVSFKVCSIEMQEIPKRSQFSFGKLDRDLTFFMKGWILASIHLGANFGGLQSCIAEGHGWEPAQGNLLPLPVCRRRVGQKECLCPGGCDGYAEPSADHVPVS